MKNPIISVVMSVYNGEKYVSEAIDSILNQTFTDFEFLITNDGSTDNTPIILNKYATKDSRIIVIHQENAGLTESLNRMISKAKGEFIARMDADDISLPERFEKQINKLQGKPDYLAVGCWYQNIDKNNIPTYEVVFPDKPKLLRKYLQKGINRYAHGCVMIRKKAFDNLGLSYRFKYGQDFDLWIRMSEYGSLGMVEEILFQKRNLSKNLSISVLPRRAALMKLMLNLANERKKYGNEFSDWNEEERRIFNNIPMWTEKEKINYERYVEAICFLYSGENSKARRLLLPEINDAKKFKNLSLLYYIFYLPGFVTAPILRLINRLNCKRLFERIPQT